MAMRDGTESDEMSEEFSVADLLAAIDGVIAEGADSAPEERLASFHLLARLAAVGFGGDPGAAGRIWGLIAEAEGGADASDLLGRLREVCGQADPAPSQPQDAGNGDVPGPRTHAAPEE